MCYHPMNIKASSSAGSRFQFVPCGKCEECRDVQKSAWSFRLCAEIESCKSKGWKVGFCTLTYSPENLPYLDKKFFKPGSSTYFQDIPCFNRSHVRDYIHALRNWFFKEYQVKSVKYMVVSEYGTTTARPHYHLLLAWPPVGFSRVRDVSGRFVKEGCRFVRERCFIDGSVVHAWLKKHWSYGFLLPQNFEGGFRNKNGVCVEIKSFEVLNAGVFAARYAAKYVCKDLRFPELLKPEDFESELTDDDIKALKDVSPFHMQSQSLGLSLIKNATPSQLVQLMESGYCFDCETEYKQLPVYLKNRILFSPEYHLFEEIDQDTGEVVIKRLVRRKATKFFVDHYEEIYERKVSAYQDVINEVMRLDFWLSRGVSAETAENFVNGVKSASCLFRDFSPRKAAEYYLSYYGVDYAECYDIARPLQWFRRFMSVYDEFGDDVGNMIDVGNAELIDYSLKDSITVFWTGVFKCLMATNGYKQHDYDVDEVYEFFNPKVA